MSTTLATSGDNTQDPRNPELVTQLKAYMIRTGLQDNTRDRANIGKSLGYGDGTAVYRYLAGKPEGDLVRFETRLASFLDNELRIEGGGALVTDPDAFIMPSMFSFFNTVRDHGRIGVAKGDAGIGKSCACRAYTSQHKSNTLYIHVWAWAAGKKALASELVRYSGVNIGKRETPEAALARYCRDNKTMIILDNAQRLTASARNWLADFYDYCGVAIALVGNPEIETQWAKVDQHHRRVGLRRDVSIDLFDSNPAMNTAKATADHLIRLHLPEGQGNPAVKKRVMEILTTRGSGACGAVVSHASLAHLMINKAPDIDPLKALTLASSQLITQAA